MSEREAPQPSQEEIELFANAFSNLFVQQLSDRQNQAASQRTSLNPYFCRQCQSLTFDTLLSGFKVHENYGALILAAFSCPLCQVLLSALVNQPPDNWWGDEEPLISDIVSAKLVLDARELNKFPERLEITVFRPQEEIDKLLEQSQYTKDPEIRILKHAIVCIDRNYPLSSELRIRPIREKADCEENIHLISSWIRDCAENHEDCPSKPQGESLPTLPARVIDVGPPDGSQEPRLWQTDSDRGSWIALSYCWGKADFLKLLKESIEEFELGIPMASMPQTFRDAIKLTRHLGLRYLWIDALCIIQDSEEDWREQASQMPNIYAAAYITIASSANDTPFDGLFDKRNYDFTHGLSVKLDLGPEKGVLEFTTRRHYHSAAGHSQHDPLVKDHLVDRGWCLQEKVLSKRFLTFHPTEMSYMCSKHILLESYYEQDPTWQLKQRGPFGANVRRFEDGDGAWKNDFFAIVRDAHKPGNAENPNREMVNHQRREEAEQGIMMFYMSTTNEISHLHKLHERWYVILHDYTTRQLTYEKDKLVAISGVAKYILAHSGMADEYHAGIFKSMLPQALMWKIPQQKQRDGAWTNTRPKIYRAPSWSWASMNQYLDFERCWEYINEPATCEILSMDSTPVGKDTCADVKDAKIVIRGKAKSALINIHNDHLCHPAPEEIGHGGGYLGLGTRHLDDEPTADRLVVCLELWKNQGLLLFEREDEEGVFERVGIYSMNEWYRPQEEDPFREFTII